MDEVKGWWNAKKCIQFFTWKILLFAIWHCTLAKERPLVSRHAFQTVTGADVTSFLLTVCRTRYVAIFSVITNISTTLPIAEHESFSYMSDKVMINLLSSIAQIKSNTVYIKMTKMLLSTFSITIYQVCPVSVSPRLMIFYCVHWLNARNSVEVFL